MGGFTITGGFGGLMRMACKACDADLERDPKTGNYRCPDPACGKGGLSSPGGIVTTVDDDGNVLLTGGQKPS